MITEGDPCVPCVPNSDQEKVKIITDFILHTPPGEFREIFNDVRTLINNDNLLKTGVGAACAQYHREQLTPVKIKNSDHFVLITEHNDLANSRYFDPRSKQSFRYDHIGKNTSDYKVWECDKTLERYRAPLERELDTYVAHHFQNGVCNVFAKRENPRGVILIACIQGHNYQPENFWNGCWRSQWKFTIVSKSAHIVGSVKVQVHYYEDGNVQLISSKEFKETIHVPIKEQLIKEFVRIVNSYESDYQTAISLNFKNMSDTTFKALRRVLPVTRAKIDWNKLAAYNVGKELKNG